jgi:hypothetical protein
MMYIATTVKRIPAFIELKALNREDKGSYYLYTLPSSMWRMHNGGLIWQCPSMDGFSYERFHGYRLYGNNRLMVPKNVPNLDEMMVEYYRYPYQIEEDDKDDTELDNTPETHEALPYYIAAQLLLYDDPFRYSALWNAFETRLGRITEPITTEYSGVDDAYGGFNIPGV